MKRRLDLLPVSQALREGVSLSCLFSAHYLHWIIVLVVDTHLTISHCNTHITLYTVYMYKHYALLVINQIAYWESWLGNAGRGQFLVRSKVSKGPQADFKNAKHTLSITMILLS